MTTASGEAAERMRAVVIADTGGLDKLVVTDVPTPEPKPGWVRIKVRAFGVNESEVSTRKGESDPEVTYPRVPGIEAVGVVDAAPADSGLRPGQQVATMMGGMGRSFDGAYAQYTLVPVGQVIGFESDLPWATLGALPEMFQTAYGSLTTGLDLCSGQTLLIRGGTSTVGLSAATIAKDMGATVLSTTRRPERAEDLRAIGVDHPLVDDGEIARQVRRLYPDGIDAALELVAGPALPDTLRALRTHGTACFTGSLSGEWVIPQFSPFAYIPSGVRLTVYGGDATDLPPDVFDHQLKAIADGRLHVAIAKVYHGLEQVRDAHADLEAGTSAGKHVVLLDD
ncbi:alcohol dehydrogenase catalytic domain-containing protein [Phytomonospora endophytica]|uniref:NADPH:quinone reductase-like Zn-dependent oxidoreductase n=1 Tax=Phytomonospora endophytica TaxID=714109 RepID=A0A841FZ38_9ACTN|nr:zinc-binding dehydrogenase [Phytomonospora endophytica]MBB6038617.1 NADPH:quinone reductase-like Zn-dependent oxidoreductase [Phytomonospora endophytica]GIG69239.1 NADPH:quinone reductase [Phytomonospora endophytica]